uniref:Replication protein A 70 kDa DNA-binding subunit n=1 Tax=Tetranychus urticae TaxID=32264 RepID=T1KWF4_TETUR
MASCPIAALNLCRKNWIICGKVVAKSEIKQWSNLNGNGCFFNFVIADNTGCIKAIAFNIQCERFFQSVTLNNTYYITNGTVRETKKQFMELSNAYEIHLYSNAQITLAEDVVVKEPECKFIKIADLSDTPANELINIICVVKNVEDLEEYGIDKVNYKRNVVLIDDSESEVKLTLWNEKAQRFDCKEGCIIIAKRLKVSDYNGKNLMAIDVSHLEIDPDAPETATLKDWFFKHGTKMSKNRLTLEPKKINLQTIKKINSSVNVHCDATLIEIKACNFYVSCPDGCNKKLIEDESGLLYCDACKKVMMEGNQKLVLKVKIADFTASIDLTIYSEIIEALLKCKCEQLSILEMENRFDFESKFHRSLVLHMFAFDIKIKMVTRDGILCPEYIRIK